jgi:hypothetical protein
MEDIPLKSSPLRDLLPPVIALVLLVSVCFCRNPFFPPTGMPDKAPSLRIKPEGVMNQLIIAYQTKDLFLFKDLFPSSNTFRFYVSPSFVTSYNSGTRNYANPPDLRDTLLLYTSEFSYYYYWTQEVEIRSHKTFFLKAATINFTQKPDLQYRPILNEKGDTTNFEVKMTNGEIDIVTASPAEEYIIAIEKQVFLLERDVDSLWVIRKWYDFGSQ